MNIGIIGTNGISDRMINAAQNVPEMTIYAVYSRSEETGNAFADKHKIKNVYTDYNLFLDDKNIEAVYIASPNFMHCKQAVEAMKHGKHVLCEKVIASNTAELNLMKKTAQENGVILLEAMRPAFDPLITGLKDQLKKIGTIRRVSFEYCQYSSRYDKFKKGEILNAFNPELSNAAIMDIGVYCIYVFVQLFGMPDSIKSFSTKLHNGMEGHGTLIMQYEDMIGEITYSKIMDSVIPSVIQGEKGSIVIDSIATASDIKIIYRDGTVEQIFKISPEDNMKYELMEFVNQINNSHADDQYLTYSSMTMRIIDEVRKQNKICFPADRQDI